jgi:hypothetical protein
MSFMDYWLVSLLLTIATYALFFEIMRRGIRVVRSQLKGQPARTTGVSRIWVAAVSRPATTILFFLCAYELPIMVGVTAASILSQYVATQILENWWLVAFLMTPPFISALGMPRLLAGTWAMGEGEDDPENEREEFVRLH